MAVLAFVLYRYVISEVGIESFGLWSVVLSIGAFYRLAECGFSEAVVRFLPMAHGVAGGLESKVIIETATTTCALLLVFLLPISYFAFPRILEWSVGVEGLKKCLPLIPYVVISFAISVFGSIWSSALDGFHRTDIRTNIALLGQIVMLGAALVMVPKAGTLGLAAAHLMSSALVAGVAWICVRRELKCVQVFPFGWSYPAVKKLLSYGLGVQTSSLLMLLFDPLARVFASRFGDLSAVAYFDIANQVVTRVRALIVSANQTVVPEIASAVRSAGSALNLFYERNWRVVVFVSLIVYGFLYVISGLVSYIFLGSVVADFLFFYELIVLAWLLNTLNIPAHFFNLGLGKVRPNVYSSLIVSFLNLSLGWVLGAALGALGVVIAYAIALVLGSVYLVLEIGVRLGVSHVKIIRASFSVPGVLLPLVMALSHVFWREFDSQAPVWTIPLFLLFAFVGWRTSGRSVFSSSS